MSRAQRIAGLVALLRSFGHESALVGGVAVSIRARERFTRDIDIAVAVASDAEAESLAFAMQRHGYVLQMVVEQEAKQVLGTMRFSAPAAPDREPEIDLLCASCGIENEIVAAATSVELQAGLFVPVAGTSHLIAMKILAAREGREQDVGDLRALLAVASAEQVEEAWAALRLIKERGFDRGKDLLGELGKLTDPAP